MNSKTKIFLLAVWIILIILSNCLRRPQSTVEWSPAKTTHTIAPNAHLQLLWEMPIYTGDDSFGCPCAAADGSLYLVGGGIATEKPQMMSFDSEDGTRKWSKEVDSTRFATSKTQIFFSQDQNVISLSLEDGQINWKTWLPQARYIGDILYYDNKIFVQATGHPFFVLSPEDGKVISKYSAIESFRRDYPMVPFYPQNNFQPIFIGEDAVFTLGTGDYTLERSNITTYKVEWEIEYDSISNPALIHDTLFYVSSDDKIKAINVHTGELVYEVLIEPTIGFFDMSIGSQHDGYYLCGDEANGILYMILGDSRQLFSFLVDE